MEYEATGASLFQLLDHNFVQDEAFVQAWSGAQAPFQATEVEAEVAASHLEPFPSQPLLPVVYSDPEAVPRDCLVAEAGDEEDLLLDPENAVLLSNNCLVELQGAKHVLHIDHDLRQVAAIPLRDQQQATNSYNETQTEDQPSNPSLDWGALANLLGKRGRGRPRKDRDFQPESTLRVSLLLLSPSPQPALLVQIPLQDVPPTLPMSELCERILGAMVSRESISGPASFDVPAVEGELTLTADITVLGGSFSWIQQSVVVPVDRGDPVEDEAFFRVRVSLPIADELLHCVACDFETHYEAQLGRHLETDHLGHDLDPASIEKCPKCELSTANRDCLIDHYVRRHPQLVCGPCAVIVDQPYLMRKHNERHDPGTINRCDLCGKTYKNQYILRSHINLIHSPTDFVFECDVCRKQFDRKSHLVRHLRTHTDSVKPFACQFCPYRARERGDLNKHLRAHSDPTFFCGHCDKAFTHQKSLRLHEKRHAATRDYKCSLCDFSAFTYNNVRKHIERVHAAQVSV